MSERPRSSPHQKSHEVIYIFLSDKFWFLSFRGATVFCKFSSETESGALLFSSNKESCSEILLRLRIKFWQLTALEQEVSFKRLEEPVSLPLIVPQAEGTWHPNLIPEINTELRCVNTLGLTESCEQLLLWILALVWLGHPWGSDVSESFDSLARLVSAKCGVFLSISRSHEHCDVRKHPEIEMLHSCALQQSSFQECGIVRF